MNQACRILFPQALNEDLPKGRGRGDLRATGAYGKSFAPFVPGAGGQLQKDMQLNLPRDRFFNDRRSLLAAIDRLNRRVDAEGGIATSDQLQQQAYQLLLGGGVADALDLSKEDPRVVERYDTNRFVQPHNWDIVSRGKRGYYTGHAQSLGKLLLMARRLCETGCGFVTIHAGYQGVWDMHADGNNLNMANGMAAVGHSFDHAVAALIEDLRERGLEDRILLVACGEMGRTPKLNKRGGRDHWSRLAPLLLHGGGIRSGQVIGRSTRDGGEPDSDPLTPRHLIATIMQTLFDAGQLRVARGVPETVSRVVQAEPIPNLR